MSLDASAALRSGLPVRPTGASRKSVPLVLFFFSMSIIVAAWYWLAAPVLLDHAPIDPAKKLDCVSYAPFRSGQTPWNSDIIISPEQIAEDLGQLAGISNCIRTYSVENGLDKVPQLASKVGLKVILGIWLGRDRTKNADLIDTAVALAKAYPGTVTSVVAGSEVLLRGEMTVSDLREVIRSVKARITTPVTYADSWDFWLRHREMADDVDFVTVHMLPFWEDVPIRAEDAAAHVIDIYGKVALAFPGKNILIGEAGWPSKGRMRDVALPSRINQAHFISELLDRAGQEKIRVNLFEAYDESWKRQWEGTVGAHWGLLDGDSRQIKHAHGAAVSNYPFWKMQLGAGLAFGVCVFAVALLTLWRRRTATGLVPWLAVSACATTGGILLGLGAEKAFYENYGIAGLLNQGWLLTAAIALPLLCANALMAGRPLPSFRELLGPRESWPSSVPALVLGVVLMITTLITVEVALGLVFDPRSRDFPFASVTMAAVPLWTVALLCRRKSDNGVTAETVFAGLLAAAALFLFFNEGVHNWQSLWTAAAFLLFGAALWPPRFVAVWSALPNMPFVFRKTLRKQQLAVQPVAVASLPSPKPQDAAGFVATTSKVECDK
ncbi:MULTISPECIES: glycosyl hydrolase family 17 protein [unclassified Bradyrhizobium]|uniref:glycoside hydrolase family 17 protein n=1 Tax=unclassified Bradyrhizobium TaxID=2631580 RepID=UPI001BA8ED46|nr:MULTISPECIES: glycosyl hydrolase family 17 protein [unclassified Bradyrhizobium]MBR1230165.1 beta-(1-6) glucans synthase [Bradyrhizobium sp. AUGA SZCCT0176]MBR1302019.1 beta-(1-6) glucans synthase [Bradyrhizobium sp. AUGA SZCCT0042]